MNKKDFFELLLETLDLKSDEVTMETNFQNYDFDSFSKLSIIMLIDTCMGKTISPIQLMECEKMEDIVNLAFED